MKKQLLITIPFITPCLFTAVLSMYNIAGQLVKTIFNEYKNAGDYTINVKTDKTSAGVYYLKFKAGESSYTRKVVVIK